ncbi:MAG: hypothetical protein ACR2PT_22105, partial [Endozoicomonas sp.]
AQNLVVSGNLVRERRTGEYGRPSQTFLRRQGASESREHVYEISGLTRNIHKAALIGLKNVKTGGKAL